MDKPVDEWLTEQPVICVRGGFLVLPRKDYRHVEHAAAMRHCGATRRSDENGPAFVCHGGHRKFPVCTCDVSSTDDQSLHRRMPPYAHSGATRTLRDLFSDFVIIENIVQWMLSEFVRHNV